MQVTRRGFLKGALGVGAGFGLLGRRARACAGRRPKLRVRHARESTTICPYCAVGCGAIVSASGGKVIIIGAPPVDEAPIPVADLILRELDIGGIFRYANMYPRAIEAVGAGLIDVKSMITHHYSLAETREALVFADENKSDCLKVAVSV